MILFDLIPKILAVIFVIGMLKFLYDMLFSDENDELGSKHKNEK